jgi:hypothetical protein
MGSNLRISNADIRRACVLVERTTDVIKKRCELREVDGSLQIVDVRTLTSSVFATSSRTPTLESLRSDLDPEFGIFNDYYFHTIYTDGSRSVGGGEIVNLFSLRSTTLTGNLVLSRSGKRPGLLVYRAI